MQRRPTISNAGWTTAVLKVILTGGMLVREPGPRYIIHGTQGSYIKYDDDPQEALLKEGILPTIPHWGEESPERWGLLHAEVGGKLIREPYPSLPGNYGLYYEHLAAHAAAWGAAEGAAGAEL